ncbi:Small ubiquitin-related modifier, SUMO [Metarhizium album ARSEF 1941]|uniref:Small ubiquitin-related modifier, SUMO n=1 Tax=Metarhizium album (strain ARSEF 1941) TaxID=1081103 RepID=A0A0B2X2U7_METAS|nr:Small ubiquitin-related modifier, SUMO [Metarhizium album ARSEF 1941]KHO00078.1 Small ubiquitin-related modifier, SUMO [Metarhizium album ARSEF 1941]
MSEDVTPPRPKVKKLPFKPTALRLATPSDDTGLDDGLDLFRRCKEMEPIKAADRKRRMRRKQKQKQKQEEEEEARRKSAESAKRPLDDHDDGEFEAAVGAQPHKSPRIDRRGTPATYPSKDGDVSVSDLVTPPASKRTRPDLTPSKGAKLHVENIDSSPGDSPSARLLRSHTKTAPPASLHRVARMPKAAPAPVVLIESDDDDVEAMPGSKQRGDGIEILESSLAATASDEDDSDGDEFSEYVRKAEEQRARDQMLSVGADGEATKKPIDILVTSVVRGTKPCCFKFLFDKQLRIARNTWLTLQHRKGILLDVQREDDIVLTWRRQRVYTFSTLLTLGIRPQGNGRAVVDGNGSEGLADGQTRVHMEAWTLDLFREMEREEELRKKREAGELSDEDDAAAPEEPSAEEVKIRVILKARNLEDVNLTVRPETTVETLITGFRAQRSIGSEKDVGLWFDGERLEEHVTMDEAEIDDMDTFEVHVRQGIVACQHE